MKKVVCINKREFKNLTLNKEYLVIEETADRFTIDNDGDVRASYAKKYFRAVEGESTGMGAAPVKKEPKIKLYSTWRELLEDKGINLQSDDQGIEVELKPNYTFDLYVSEQSNSCGVAEVDGLNDLLHVVSSIYTAHSTLVPNDDAVGLLRTIMQMIIEELSIFEDVTSDVITSRTSGNRIFVTVIPYNFFEG